MLRATSGNSPLAPTIQASVALTPEQAIASLGVVLPPAPLPGLSAEFDADGFMAAHAKSAELFSHFHDTQVCGGSELRLPLVHCGGNASLSRAQRPNLLFGGEGFVWGGGFKYWTSDEI